MATDTRPELTTNARARIAMAALGVVLVIGTVGFMAIERWSFIDAAYMTVITLSTIGYGEVHPLDTAGRIFDMVLIIGGVATGLYALGALAEGALEQRIFQNIVRERRMAREIERLTDHYIVCGFGRVGMSVAMELAREARQFVVIEQDPALVEACRAAGYHVVLGDATQDMILVQAGVERAKGVVTALDSDAANLYITLSCRSLRASLFIVARASAESVEPKLVRAGANRVLCPYSLTGRRLAEMVIEPEMIDVVEVIGRHSHLELYLEEITACSGSALIGRPLGDATIRVETGAAIIAMKKYDGTLLANPSPQLRINAEDTMVAIGTHEQLRRFRALAANGEIAAPAPSDAVTGRDEA
ncbi:MAG: potassium channel protein [Thermomicrobia bacterium]|nr:potassium channel protein [Thermomicrobia bacterium]